MKGLINLRQCTKLPWEANQKAFFSAINVKSSCNFLQYCPMPMPITHSWPSCFRLPSLSSFLQLNYSIWWPILCSPSSNSENTLLTRRFLCLAATSWQRPVSFPPLANRYTVHQWNYVRVCNPSTVVYLLFNMLDIRLPLNWLKWTNI